MGNVISFGNTPQAVDDTFTSAQTGLTEDLLKIVILDVMTNDLGGNAKTLFSIDNGISAGGSSPTDLMTQDTARAEATSGDTSLNGAKIWITTDGKVGYDANFLTAAFKAQLNTLQSGQYLTDSFTYAIRLGNGTLSWATAIVQFGGYNDAAVISGTTSGSVIEASGVSNGTPGTPTASGTLTDTDVDNTPNTFQAVGAGAASDHGYGTFGMTAGGVWTYTLNNSNGAVQGLNVGQTLTDTFTVHTTDGTAQQVTVTITGANDAAVISGTSTGLVIEAGGISNATPGTPTASGTLTDTDVDNTPNTFQAVGAGAASDHGYGTFGMTAGGVWTYTLNNSNGAVQGLNVGQTLIDTFTVHTADGTAQQVTVTINGANDAPVAVADSNAGNAVVEAGINPGNTPFAGDPSAAGNVLTNDTDVDTGDTKTVSAVNGVAANVGISVTGTYGSLTLGAGGGYTYTLDNADPDTQALAQGATATDVFTYTVKDSQGATSTTSLTIDITGTNDAPVITSAAQSGNVSEGDNLPAASMSASGQVTFTDVDTSDTHSLTVSAAAAHGTASVDADGTWHYTVTDAGAVDALAVGEHLADSFTVQVDDHNGGLATQVVMGSPGTELEFAL